MNVRGVILTGASAAVHGVARRMKDAGIGDIIVVCGAADAARLRRGDAELCFALAQNPRGEVDALRHAAEFLGRDSALVAVKDCDVGELLHRRKKNPRGVAAVDGGYFFNAELHRALTNETLNGEQNLSAAAHAAGGKT
ncbi:MAG: hypothetical protein OXU29_03455 [Gammaproteobacteria bacterium]|nr:hypothetical protein [Gammaproteobacteria bacterium]